MTGNAGSVTINARESVEVSGRVLRNPNPSSVSLSAPIVAETLLLIIDCPGAEW